MWPSPRPLIFANGTPHAATIGPTAIDVLSPTPPVECLSTTLRPSAERRSTVSPRRDHRVRQRVGLRARSARGRRPPCRTRPSGSRAPRRARSRASARSSSSAVELAAVALALDQLGRPDHLGSKSSIGLPEGSRTTHQLPAGPSTRSPSRASPASGGLELGNLEHDPVPATRRGAFLIPAGAARPAQPELEARRARRSSPGRTSAPRGSRAGRRRSGRPRRGRRRDSGRSHSRLDDRLPRECPGPAACRRARR